MHFFYITSPCFICGGGWGILFTCITKYTSFWFHICSRNAAQTCLWIQVSSRRATVCETQNHLRSGCRLISTSSINCLQKRKVWEKRNYRQHKYQCRGGSEDRLVWWPVVLNMWKEGNGKTNEAKHPNPWDMETHVPLGLQVLSSFHPVFCPCKTTCKYLAGRLGRVRYEIRCFVNGLTWELP